MTNTDVQSIALDAIKLGDMVAAAEALKIGHCRLNRTHVKAAARELVRQGRVADAMLALIEFGRFNRDGALVELADPPSIAVGDIFFASWGYDQTNVDFYEVVEVKRSTVVIRKVAKNYLASQSSASRDAVKPARRAFVGAPMQKRVLKTYRGEPMLNVLDFAYAYLWDGVTALHETASGYGH